MQSHLTVARKIGKIIENIGKDKPGTKRKKIINLIVFTPVSPHPHVTHAPPTLTIQQTASASGFLYGAAAPHWRSGTAPHS